MRAGDESAEGLSRRQLLRAGSIYGGALWVGLQLPAPGARARAPGPAKTLTPAEWRTVRAITGRIIPTDHEPGAIEADCVDFIERALAGPDARALPVYQLGLRGTEAVSRARFEKAFTALGSALQDEVLASLERGAPEGWPDGSVPSPVFFETVRAHTIIGFLADPKHGGNRDHTGWRVVGYPGPRHAGGGYTPQQMLGQEPIRAVWDEPV